MANDDELEVGSDAGDTAIEEKVKLTLDVKIDTKSACERHVTVTVSRDDIDRKLNEAYSKLMPEAQVPGFRHGRAPRKLVEKKFRKEINDQIKGTLIMESLEQISEEQSMTPISEPDFDPGAVVVPESGPMKFEFDIEVRPEFDTPNWKGLKIERPVRDFTDADVDAQLKRVLAQNGKLVPHDGAAAEGDYLVLNLSFKNNGEEISGVKEETIRIRPTLSFRDGKIEKFDKLMSGVKAGETRKCKAKLADDAPNEALRGAEIDAEFEVLEVKKLELPEITPELLAGLGNFETEEELRNAIKDSLVRKLEFHQQQRVREQICELLTESAKWDLPPALLKRQSRRELDRTVLELRRSGFSDDEIRAYGNELMQNSQKETAKSLKEHFVLEKIAEEEKIEDLPEDYDTEVALIAKQSGENPRRVRAQIEKRGLLDALRNQIIERKTIELIQATAKVKEVPYKMDEQDTEAMDSSAGGGDEGDIPEAQAEPGKSYLAKEEKTEKAE
jgi:trigger factor